jgi:hypothetical protein
MTQRFEGYKFTVLAETYQTSEGGRLVKGNTFTRPVGHPSIPLLSDDKSLKCEPHTFINANVTPPVDGESETDTFATDVNLTEVEGVEPDWAEKLTEVDITTAKQVMDADDETLTKPNGIGKATAKKLRAFAEAALLEVNN